MEVPPPVTGGAAGTQFTLSAADLGSLGIGSPVYFRRLPVGQVVAFDLSADGKSVTVRVFVNAPYDKYVGADTRFWNASGFDVSLTANGLDVRTQSLVALLEGGVAFDTPPSGTVSAPLAASASYRLYPDRTTAMRQDEGIATHYVLYFDESLRGLSVGAPVTFFGVPVGEVTAVGLAFTEKTLAVRPRVDIVVYPQRMIANLPAVQEKLAETMVKSAATRHAIMLRMVEQRGLRAQLTTGSLLTGQLYVALGYFPGAPKATFDANATPPVLPSVTSALPDLEAKLSSIIAKLDRVPLDAIGDGAEAEPRDARADAAGREPRARQLRRAGDAGAEVDARRRQVRVRVRGAHADEHREQPHRRRRARTGRVAQRDAGTRARRPQPAGARRLPRTASGSPDQGKTREAPPK